MLSLTKKFDYLNSVPLVIWGRDADETNVEFGPFEFRRCRFCVHVRHASVETTESQETGMTGLMNKNVT
jgi:hypothetical protein